MLWWLLRQLKSKCLSDNCSKVRESAAYALGEIGAAKAIPALNQLLQDPSATSEPWQTWFGAQLED